MDKLNLGGAWMRDAERGWTTSQTWDERIVQHKKECLVLSDYALLVHDCEIFRQHRPNKILAGAFYSWAREEAGTFPRTIAVGKVLAVFPRTKAGFSHAHKFIWAAKIALAVQRNTDLQANQKGLVLPPLNPNDLLWNDVSNALGTKILALVRLDAEKNGVRRSRELLKEIEGMITANLTNLKIGG